MSFFYEFNVVIVYDNFLLAQCQIWWSLTVCVNPCPVGVTRKEPQSPGGLSEHRGKIDG